MADDFSKGSASGAGAASAIRRLNRELKEINQNPSKFWHAGPANDDLFEWHFTMKGPKGTEFERGIYHGRIVLPLNYPFAPPHIMLLTPNGRFETNKKICLSISNYHPELWQPAWGLRTMIEALRSFFPTAPEGALGSLNYSAEARRKIAEEETRHWKCNVCDKTNLEMLPYCDECDEEDPASAAAVSSKPAEEKPKEAESTPAVSMTEAVSAVSATEADDTKNGKERTSQIQDKSRSPLSSSSSSSDDEDPVMENKVEISRTPAVPTTGSTASSTAPANAASVTTTALATSAPVPEKTSSTSATNPKSTSNIPNPKSPISGAGTGVSTDKAGAITTGNTTVGLRNAAQIAELVSGEKPAGGKQSAEAIKEAKKKHLMGQPKPQRNICRELLPERSPVFMLDTFIGMLLMVFLYSCGRFANEFQVK